MLQIIIAGLALALAACAQPLRLEKTIPLSGVQGRIDHMSIDFVKRRLFVAALGNNTVEVIDLAAGKRAQTVRGLREPQGVFYLPANDRLYVANGGDGRVSIFDGSSLKLIKTIKCGDDADNIRYDAGRNRIYAGYGSGALREMDPDGNTIADITLDAHPESFQIEKSSPRIFVNLPKSRKIVAIDRNSKSTIATWSTGGPLSNYAMALDEPDHRLFVVCRQPARLIVLDTDAGRIVQTLPAAGDCDDLFYDAKLKRLYASGGEGVISVFEQRDADHYTESDRVKTVPGARTAFFSPDLARLYVAARRQGIHEAEIRVYAIEP